MSPEHVAPLVSVLVSERSEVNGQVIVAGGGWARRTATVEVDSSSTSGRTRQLMRPRNCRRVRGELTGVCSEFRDAQESYEDFCAHVVGDLRQP